MRLVPLTFFSSCAAAKERVIISYSLLSTRGRSKAALCSAYFFLVSRSLPFLFRFSFPRVLFARSVLLVAGVSPRGDSGLGAIVSTRWNRAVYSVQGRSDDSGGTLRVAIPRIVCVIRGNDTRCSKMNKDIGSGVNPSRRRGL